MKDLRGHVQTKNDGYWARTTFRNKRTLCFLEPFHGVGQSQIAQYNKETNMQSPRWEEGWRQEEFMWGVWEGEMKTGECPWSATAKKELTKKKKYWIFVTIPHVRLSLSSPLWTLWLSLRPSQVYFRMRGKEWEATQEFYVREGRKLRLGLLCGEVCCCLADIVYWESEKGQIVLGKEQGNLTRGPESSPKHYATSLSANGQQLKKLGKEGWHHRVIVWNNYFGSN